MPQSPSPRFFESLTRDLVERSASSLLGIYGPRTDPLRAFLSQVLQRPAGHPDSFLADPAFEAIFDWQQVKPAMDDLALQGFLTEALVEAMDTKAADEQLAETVSRWIGIPIHTSMPPGNSSSVTNRSQY